MAHVCSTKGSQVNDYQTDTISSYNLTWTSEFAHGSLGLANSTFCHINALFPLGGGGGDPGVLQHDSHASALSL